MIKKKCKECGTLIDLYAQEYCVICHGNYGWWHTCDKHEDIIFRDEVKECPVCNAKAAITGNIEKKSNLEPSAGEPTAKQINKVTDSTSRTSESAQIKQLAKVRSERLINDELEKKTKVSVLSAVAMFLFFGSMPTISLGGNPVMTLFGLFFAIVGFRCWIERTTYKRIIEKKSLEDFFISIYLPSLWSYFWRSLLTMIGIAVVIEVLAGQNWKEGYGYLSGTISAYWIMGSIFIIDIPFWVKRKVTKLTNQQ